MKRGSYAGGLGCAVVQGWNRKIFREDTQFTIAPAVQPPILLIFGVRKGQAADNVARVELKFVLIRSFVGVRCCLFPIYAAWALCWYATGVDAR